MTETKHLGKYEILEELGRGGFGIVYKARDAVLDRVVAVKVLHPNLVNDLSFVSRFRNEARLAAQLDHPNIVPVHDFGESEGLYYIVMGYMPGGSLKERLQKEGALPEEKAITTLRQVCEGLGYAHRKDIIHRDLKPGNILFDEEGEARVSDLGFAKLLHSDSSASFTISGGVVGTPAYMAPEIWRGESATPQTDIYSLGCILYEMLTGKVLFEGGSAAEVMTMHIIRGPKIGAKALSLFWKKILEQCLASRPQNRYLSIQDVLGDLHEPILEETASPDEYRQSEAFLENRSIDKKENLAAINASNIINVVKEQFDPQADFVGLTFPNNPISESHEIDNIVCTSKYGKKPFFTRVFLFVLVIVILLIVLLFMPDSWWCFLTFNSLSGCHP